MPTAGMLVADKINLGHAVTVAENARGDGGQSIMLPFLLLCPFDLQKTLRVLSKKD